MILAALTGLVAMAADSPRVVEVFPAEGATSVDPTTEIRLRFDRDMDPNRAFLAWDGREQAGFRTRGPLRYDPATRTFILPVSLTPGSNHRITAGRDRGGQLKPEGFASTEGVVAERFSWSFTTAAPSPARGNAEPPRVTAVDPPPDSQVGLLTLLRVAFDRPMDPTAYGVSGPEPAELSREPELLGPPQYDREDRAFTLLLRLPQDWNGEVRLVGFRSADGALARPIVLPYRTRREPLAETLRVKVERTGRDDPELVRFIERVRAARRGVHSLREEVRTTSTFGLRSPMWHQHYSG